MSAAPDAVKRIEAALDLGFSLSEAIPNVLGRPLAAFAREHGHRESEVSMCLGGYPGRVYGAIRDDLATELGVTREDVDHLVARASGIEGGASAARGPDPGTSGSPRDPAPDRSVTRGSTTGDAPVTTDGVGS